MSKLEETIRELKYTPDGLIPAIVVDADNGQVLMMAWMNAATVKSTVESGRPHFWSRSRGKIWIKGESSGHVQEVRAMYADCDLDTLLIEVSQHGGACHEGYRSCFYRRLGAEGGWEVVAEKIFDPEEAYRKGT